MTTRRRVLLPLALVPIAGMAVWAGGAAEPTHPAGRFHLALDEFTALWRDLAGVRLAGAAAAPQFPDAVTALDGKTVSLRGFMVSLTEGGPQRRFILAANPVGCPACERPGPASMLHVHARVPAPETRNAVIVSGTLRLNPHEGLFYRLEQATVRYA
ncbi:DUF3299 domain-containing protein [Azospirillum sp. TSO22-1]|uniref:DUF3299 domain-containing protein n=1 Tax=Azospirillum sp. TSO22-1 TaxID=716789 RepID=UPI000D61C25A|nr:DUF3299 domain-containing protein [Azospirillum sp. TSO22-1]PWC43879.1 hypothetical protein TSO221_19220 [Azospirillum sp. TSO22-1]